jgi:hypothetical protein
MKSIKQNIQTHPHYGFILSKSVFLLIYQSQHQNLETQKLYKNQYLNIKGASVCKWMFENDEKYIRTHIITPAP